MLAFLFPGQGSQAPGMGRALTEAYPEAAAVFAEADRVLGFSLSQLCFEGSEDDLKPTEIAQPALLTCSTAALRCIEARGIRPTVAAGHSLGEYSALVCAGALSFEAALRLVRTRGELMARAGQETPGAMAAVLGMTGAAVTAVCESVDGVVVPANFNSPGQVVISGEVEAVKAASAAAKTAGASRVIPLAVSGAFHSPLMHAAAQQMVIELAGAAVLPARIPVIDNTSAEVIEQPEAIRAALALQVESSVRWEESVAALGRMGVTHFVEVGPGKVLSGLARKILPGAATFSVSDPAGVEGLAAFLEPAEG